MKRTSNWLKCLSIFTISCLCTGYSAAQDYRLTPPVIINDQSAEEVRQLVKHYMKSINEGRDDDSMIRDQVRTHLRRWKQMTDEGDPYAAWLVARCYAHGIQTEPSIHHAYVNYSKSARRGAPEGKLFMGICHEQGLGTEQNYSEAAYWYRQAAEDRVAVASYRLAMLHERKLIYTPNTAEVARCYCKAAQGGFIPAYLYAGFCYRRGEVVVPDAVEAFHWFHEGATRGSPESMYETAFCLRKGDGVSKDYQTAFQWFLRSAQSGYADGMIMTALGYQHGEGTPSNDVLAFGWNLKAAKLGRASAMHSVGLGYRDGRGVAKDMAQGYQWTRKAAELNDAIAMYDLANSYLMTGQGVEKNTSEAVAWFRKSADKMYRPAMSALAVCLHQGIGVEQNDAMAYFWAVSGNRLNDNKDNQFILGLFHENGWGTFVDHERAFDCFYQSHLAGNALASCKVGSYLQDGRAVPPDPVKALACFKKAADADCPQAWYLLGISNYVGLGCDKNPAVGSRCLAKAARYGMPEAQAALKTFEEDRGSRLTDSFVAGGTSANPVINDPLQNDRLQQLAKTPARAAVEKDTFTSQMDTGSALETSLKWKSFVNHLPDGPEQSALETMRRYQKDMKYQFAGLRWSNR
ncbi:MAG TPA: hypothetical protein PLN21_17230 [Gemmatales bacterium]|nr:hypothetical protein [Gemmatales bacterium]